MTPLAKSMLEKLKTCREKHATVDPCVQLSH